MPSQLSPSALKKMHAWWRAANYLSVGQIYLRENPLLDEPLTRSRSTQASLPARSGRSANPTNVAALDPDEHALRELMGYVVWRPGIGHTQMA